MFCAYLGGVGLIGVRISERIDLLRVAKSGLPVEKRLRSQAHLINHAAAHPNSPKSPSIPIQTLCAYLGGVGLIGVRISERIDLLRVVRAVYR